MMALWRSSREKKEPPRRTARPPRRSGRARRVCSSPSDCSTPPSWSFVDEVRNPPRRAPELWLCPGRSVAASSAPFRTGKRVNLLGWMSDRGGEVAQFTGSVTGVALHALCVRFVLAPKLEPGDVVIWDNARIHTPDAVALVELGRRARCLCRGTVPSSTQSRCSGRR